MINAVGYSNMTASLNNIFSSKRAQRKINLVIQHDEVDANCQNAQRFDHVMEYPESDFL